MLSEGGDAAVRHISFELTVISGAVDPTFGFTSLDWDGRIRMDPSSAYAMRRFIGVKDDYDIAFACDTDGWHRAGTAVRGNDRAHRPRSRPALSRSHRGARCASVRPSRGAGKRRAEAEAGEALAARRADHRNGRRADRTHARSRAGQRRPDRHIKAIAASGWFAARPSGTEDIYKIYAESFRGMDHLRTLVRDAQDIVDRALRCP